MRVGLSFLLIPRYSTIQSTHPRQVDNSARTPIFPQPARAAELSKTNATNAINALKTEVAGLHGQVKAADDAQTQNTKVFIESLNRLSDKVRDLQTQVTTEDLRKQLASVQDDLHKTQKGVAILEPRPTIHKFNELGRFGLVLRVA
jgi:hypothetical protein